MGTEGRTDLKGGGELADKNSDISEKDWGHSAKPSLAQ